MKQPKFTYINSVSKENVTTIEDVLKNKRLTKYLWIEFILNSQIVKIARLYLDNTVVKSAFTDALSWYLAFKWILPENKILEELYKEKTITPYRVKVNIYRQNRRAFLKGILHAQLC